MTAELHDLSIAELSDRIAARKLSPVELVDALIQRVEQYDPQTRAFVTPTFDLARRQASEAEAALAAGAARGPLHGIPFALKDIYDTRGILTSGHSRVFIDRVPTEDATATRRLYEAGAVLVGKLATHEMAHAGPSFDLPWPPARNPWNLAHFTGGSSTGSGAAVAAGLVPVALGSDTGGSIRGPASHCGVVGLMPTFGLVSRAGVITNSYTFDHCGPLARTVEDCALVLQALAGYDPKDAGSLRRPIPDYRAALGENLRGLRIGVLRHHWEEDIPASEDVRRAMDAALDVCAGWAPSSRRCRVRPLGQYFDVKIIIAESEIFSVHQKNLVARPKRLRRRLPLTGAALGAVHGQRLRPGHPRAPPDDGRDGAAVRAVRRVRHRGDGRGAEAGRLPQRLVLAEAEPAHGLERHRPAGAGAAQRLRAERAATRHADRRPALRGEHHPQASATPTSALPSGTRGARGSCRGRRPLTSSPRRCSR